MASDRRTGITGLDAEPSDPIARLAAEARWQWLMQLSVIVLAVLATALALRAASEIAVPLAAAVITGLALGPLADRLRALGLPAPLVAPLLVLTLFLLLALLASALSAPLGDWIDRAPEIAAMLQRRLAFLIHPLEAAERLQTMVSRHFGQARSALEVAVAPPPLGQSIIFSASPAIGQLLIYLVTLIFVLVGRERLRSSIVLAFQGRSRRLTALKVIAAIQQDLGHYFGTIALINLGLGLAVGLAMAAIGLSNALLWGAVAFVANFVPLVGPLIMAAVLGVVGLASFDSLAWSLAPAALYLLLHGIESQFVTPALLGRRFEINPLVIFLAIVFWSWLWGPVGAFFAAPILVAGVSAWTESMEDERSRLPV